MQLTMNWGDYLEKSVIFFLTLAGAILLWHVVLKKRTPIVEGRSLEPTFNTMALLMVLLFALLLSVGSLVIHG